MLKSRFMFLAAVIALGGSVPAAAQPAALTIDVTNFAFAPKPIHLAAGRPVTLTIVNRSGSGHDFTAPGFFAASAVQGAQPADGEIDLGPHQTRSITLTPHAGTYKAHCSHFMHRQLGMSATILVN